MFVIIYKQNDDIKNLWTTDQWHLAVDFVLRICQKENWQGTTKEYIEDHSGTEVFDNKQISIREAKQI